jgi:hypothetical protein
MIINRIKTAVDAKIRHGQAGFRKGRSYSDHVFTLSSITKQCTEWQRQFINYFINFEKALDSIHKESYGIAHQIHDL